MTAVERFPHRLTIVTGHYGTGKTEFSVNLALALAAEGAGTALACAGTKQFCCFIGPEGTVERQLRELAVLAEKEQKQGGDGAFLDNVIMYEVLSELRDIASRPGGITCACGGSRCAMEVRRSSVDLICRDCGAKLRVPAATDRDLDDLCCHMKLVLPGKK